MAGTKKSAKGVIKRIETRKKQQKVRNSPVKVRAKGRTKTRGRAQKVINIGVNMALKNVKEIFCITADNKFVSLGFMTEISGLKLKTAFIPDLIWKHIGEEGGTPEKRRARKWYVETFLPLMIQGGEVVNEGGPISVKEVKKATKAVKTKAA